ncbi:KICSTOR complex protein kaptin-like [Mytilus trossulus]|uniref:KICSTOR complex protein kaptin-like n=1 Tax=Mytilus trossulus TaxID=6551 RepID=UPI003004D10D
MEESKIGYKSWKWTDAHFCNLPTHTLLYPGMSCGISTTPQTNVYGHAKVIDPDGSNKFLVASRVGKFISLEYQITMDKLAPSAKIIPFSYIPAGAELVSLDVICKSVHHKRIVVGVTFIKFEEESEDAESTCKQYLNLYSLQEEYSGFDNIDDCFSQSIDLDFTPYQLTHTSIFVAGKLESVFLLIGSDCKIHMYREVSAMQQTFREFPTDECFPEFKDISTCVHWIDIVYFNQYSRRLTARGHRDGGITVSHVNVDSNEMLSSWSLQHDSPITCIKIFTLEYSVSQPGFISQRKDKSEQEVDPVFHVLALSALEPAAVYRNVLSNGLKEPLVLPQSNKFDVPLCVCIVDIDFDGCNEIMIGTYGQELLAYKFISQKHTTKSGKSTGNEKLDEFGDINDPNRNRHLSDEKEQRLTPVDIQDSLRSKSHENLNFKHSTENITQSNKQHKQEDYMGKKCDHFQLLWQKSFACPVMGIDRLDIMGDGMEDLVVVTLKGVHIIQPDLQEIAKVCLERMNNITQKKHKIKSDKHLSNVKSVQNKEK